MLDSRSFTLNKADLKSLGQNAVLVGLAAMLTYVGQNVSHVDLGSNAVVVVPVVCMVIDTLVKWMTNNVK